VSYGVEVMLLLLIGVPETKPVDPGPMQRGALRIALAAAKDRELVLEPEGVVPPSFLSIRGDRPPGPLPGRRRGLPESLIGVIADGHGGITRVVVLVVDEQRNDVDLCRLCGFDAT